MDEIYEDHFGPRQRCHEEREEEQPHADEEESEHVSRVIVDEVVEQQIQEFAESIPEEELDETEEEDSEISEIKKSLVKACQCQKSCYDQFTEAQIVDHILNIRGMDKSDKELYVMGTLVQTQVTVRTPEEEQENKSISHTSLMEKAFAVKCIRLFLTLVRNILQIILKHMTANGAVPITHGNKGKKPHNALAFQDIIKVVQFIINFAEENEIPLPAAPRGRDDIPLFSSTLSLKEKHS